MLDMEPVLVSHLAERQLESDSVADSSLVDTVALLGWISTNINNTDQHAFATTKLSVLGWVIFGHE